MRFIERTDIAVPDILLSRGALAYRREIQAYLDTGRFDTRPVEPPSAILQDKGLLFGLEALSAGTCAYCEMPTRALEGAVEHFRPIGGAERLDGKIDFRHYSWLAIDWDNLYLICQACSRSKANRFPVRHVGQIGDGVEVLNASEGMLLLDPCFDRPAHHLFVGRDGELRGLTERGESTIDLLRLNRPELVRSRVEVVRTVENLVDRQGYPDAASIAEHLFAGQNGFAGIALIALLQMLPERHALQVLRDRPIDSALIAQVDRYARSGEIARGLRKPRMPRPPRKKRPPTRPEQARYVRSVSISNFRGITSAIVAFPERGKHGPAKVGSLVVLGENGVGKSSLLQALALGAMGPEKVTELDLRPDWCLRDGADHGEIVVSFFDSDEENALRFSRRSRYFEGQEAVPTVVLGYGAYRLPARGAVAADKTSYDYRVHSLFDERKLVNGPFGLHQHFRRRGYLDHDRADDAMRTLNSLLLGEARASVAARSELWIEDRGRRQRLGELSSGYRSLVTIASDIMDVLYQLWEATTSGQALVLIDEIDAHLHPEWRLKIVDALRAAFPATQFLMTTHDPLVLRGLSREEVLVMTRDEEGMVGVDAPRVPDLEGLSVDQLLTSQLFGLETTMDAQLAQDLSRYYSLASKQNPSSAEIDERVTLQMRLSDRQPSGATRRERLMYAVIDRFLARPDADRSVDGWDEDAVSALLAEIDDAEQEALDDDLPPA